MRRLRIIILAALAAVLLGTAAAYWLNPPAELPVLDSGREPVLDQDGRPRVRGLTYTHVEGGVRKWTLSAQGARMDEARKHVSLTQVNIRFFRENGGWVNITGAEGQYDQDKKIVTLIGSVRGRTDDGTTLKTERISYSEPDETVSSDTWVTIAGPKFSVTGFGMKAFVREDRIVFEKQVDSRFIPVGKGPPPGATAEQP